MKKIQKLHLVKETVRNLVPSELSHVNGGGSVVTNAKVSSSACFPAQPQGTTTTSNGTITQ